jgi:long-chain acyl-CoA synthetase
LVIRTKAQVRDRSARDGSATAEESRTLAALWRTAVAESRDTPAYLAYEGDAWKHVSWPDAARRVEELAHGLLSLGVKKSDRFAILAPSTVEWALLDFALLSVGASVVPIYPTSSGSECAYKLENAEVRGIAADDARLGEIQTLRKQLPQLEHVHGFGDLDEIASMGREHAAAHPEGVDEAASAVRPNDLLTCIYTSGTTGPPKGCLLTNRCYFAMVEMLAGLPNFVRPGDRTVLFLPLAHNFGRLVHFTGARVGYTIAFCPDPAQLADALVAVKPDFLPSVPRVYEKVHAAVRAQLDSATGLQKRIADWAVGVGQRASALELDGLPVPRLLEVQRRVADRLVYSKVRARLGGKVRFGISGGAPLAREILEFFHGFGIVILEGYGLTECTSAAINRLDAYRFGTVGIPLPGCEVRIADDGEILLHGENVFSGYYRNEEATREALGDDGWLRTGDIGEFDGDGFLRITDRKKDLIATSGGKKIAPQNIEQLLQRDALVSHALIVGDRRPYITALITLNEDAIVSLASEHGFGGKAGELTKNPQVTALVQRVVDEANSELARPEQIKRFAVLRRDFTSEEGEITPTLKLKRRVCEQHFAAEIEALYAGDRS